MDIEPVGPDAYIGEDSQPAEYRVRLWTPPPHEGYAWMVDEWEVRDAPSVAPVIHWAESKALGKPVEIFVKWFDRALSRDGELVTLPRMTRVFGAPGEEGSTTETIYFQSE
jgi:hypothetical protein